MAVAHIPFDLLLRHQRSHRVYNDDVHRTGSHHRLGDLKRLIPAVRLRNIQFIYIHSDILRVDRVQRMLRINKARDPSTLLYFRDHM